jgi:hypothetical protein
LTEARSGKDTQNQWIKQQARGVLVRDQRYELKYSSCRYIDEREMPSKECTTHQDENDHQHHPGKKLP